MQAGRYRTVFLLFAIAFGIALRFFLHGEHLIGWFILVGSYTVLLAYMLWTRRRS